MNGPINLDKPSFLNQGAIFGHGDQITLFWGDLSSNAHPPQGPALLLSHFFLSRECAWWSLTHSYTFARSELKEILFKSKQTLTWQQASQELFTKQFSKIQGWFVTKKIRKAVPYVFETSQNKMTPLLLESLLAHLLDHPEGYLYGAWSKGEGLVGLSPEILLFKEKNQYKTMALAGTCANEIFLQDPQSFLEDEKENHEHQLVVDEIKKALEPFAKVSVGKRSVQQTPTLTHLKTEMEFSVDSSISVENILKSLHPTPALGCYPVEQSHEVMSLFDQWLPRGRFGAPFGFSHGEQIKIIVAIRNIIWSKEGLKIGSGCGVVEQSNLKKEWFELKQKRQAVKHMMGLL